MHNTVRITLLALAATIGCGNSSVHSVDASHSSLADARTPTSLILFGGLDGNDTLRSDTWSWDGGAWTEQSVVGPSARTGHAMATLNGTTVLFGGTDANFVLSDTWTWDGSTWTKLDVTGPSARTWTCDGATWTQRTRPGPAARFGDAMGGLHGTAIMFSGNILHETWSWDGSAWNLLNVSGPSELNGHAIASR